MRPPSSSRLACRPLAATLQHSLKPGTVRWHRFRVLCSRESSKKGRGYLWLCQLPGMPWATW